ncbi:MAG: hypothetical protein JO169_12180 [Solirubrobacterales bacterium]|nr:hypothetical protein [Solirubrobacterales bacterium]
MEPGLLGSRRPCRAAAACLASGAMILTPALPQARADAMLPPPPPPPSAARLEGTFLLSGRVTTANNVSGEHVGERVARTWAFIPRCRISVCNSLVLLRARASGQDKLILRRRGPAYYAGGGSFDAPLRCGKHDYKHGELVPFTITVRVTAAALAGGVAVASQVRATYISRARFNLTPCVTAPASDAAVYQGQLLPGPPPTPAPTADAVRRGSRS